MLIIRPGAHTEMVQNDKHHEYRTRIYPPSRLESQDAVRFAFSLQRLDMKQASITAPAEIWIEVHPSVDEQPGHTYGSYVFHDPSFVLESRSFPEPMLECEASNWPRDCRQASVSIWGGWERRTPPSQTILVADLRRIREFHFRDLNCCIEFVVSQGMANSLRVELMEKSDDGRAYTPQLRLEMEPEPQGVAHRITPRRDGVLHTFTYPLTVGDKLDAYTVCLTRREEILRNSIELVKDRNVRVP